MRVVQRLLVMPVLLLAAACAHRAAPEPVAPDARSMLHVVNHHWLDVNIIVEHDGQRSRLGTVTATSAKDFVFPRGMIGSMGEVRLIADPVGESGSIITDRIVVKPGTEVSWTLESSLQRSSLAVY